MARITQYPCNDFCAAVVTVQAGFRNHNAQGVLHGRGWGFILSKVCAGLNDHRCRIGHEPSSQRRGSRPIHFMFSRIWSTVALAELRTPGSPAPGWVPAPTR